MNIRQSNPNLPLSLFGVFRVSGGCLLPVLLASALQASPLEDADKLIGAGKADAAVEMMRQDAKKDEKDPYRLYNLGLTLYRAGRYEEAINTFQAVDTTNSRDLQALSALQLGNIQFRLAQQLRKTGQPAGAVFSMERALGYYESVNEIQAGKESKTNQGVTTAELENLLLAIAKGSMTEAARLHGLDRLREEEPVLRRSLEALQRARELAPKNPVTPPLIAETTARLVANLDQQGGQMAKDADDTKDPRAAKGKRQQAVAKYEDALALDPKNAKVAAARDEQIRKMSALLTKEAEDQASPALAKDGSQLDPKDQADLEQAKTKLDEALALDAKNTRAAELNRKIFKKLEESYVKQGDDALKAAETAEAAQKKLELVKKAADQFGKALDQNAQNQSAQEGLKKAEALLPGLYADAGKANLDKAREMQPGPAPAAAPGGLSDADLKKTADLLGKSVENLDTSLALKPGVAANEQTLAEAQKMLDAANDEANRRTAAANGSGPAREDAGGRGESDAADIGEGKMKPLSLNNIGSQRPFLGDKFWNKKIRDW
ncbi:MAG: hypothetical protein WC003_13240 [Terrimicrobiaceae bacterium]